MTDDLRFDLDIQKKDLLDLASPDGVAAFFARLRYDISTRTVHTAASLGISESVARPIRRIELLADRDLFQVYLVELTSVTVASSRALVRSFRDRGGDFLFVITSGDYSRIDFVFLDRLAENLTSTTIGSAAVGVRPRTLTFERRNPSPVALRVLRRFTWTEPDRFAQVDKIRSAYTLAEWSEQEGLFNNRALFSDHYLKTRLREDAVWRDDTSAAAFRELRDRLIARRTSGSTDSTSLRTAFYEPALATLGFVARPVRRSPNDVDLADYELFSTADAEKPLALCLTYPWMRYLDGKDSARDTETPDENPGAVVVSLLQKQDIPWIIVTNAKLWRLYSRRTHSRATNYLEIDLEEVIAEATRASSDPFRYFWILFRRSAFEEVSITREGRSEQVPFLDRLLLESDDYAKELGERLKERIFDRVFPHLAEGFLSRWDTDPSDEDLQHTYRATLTLLYRLLFLLYAESRDLLPVREVRGYYQKSLTKLRTEIADAAGSLEDEIEKNLKRALDARSTVLYTRLAELFTIVDTGNAELNVPFYDGGLFSTSPADDDDSAEADAARFLRDHAIPDIHFASAIDLLSREDDPRAGRIFIDYKSLGVRHLGSIYEGLLEFRLRFASERLGIVREKKRDVYKPWRELGEKKKTRLERDGQFIERGQLYLENDRHERKATGSYYTPDHIVKYIIEHAVGPIVDEKLDALRPQLRKAQEWHRTAPAQSRAKGETADRNYDYGAFVEQRWNSLIDEVFAIKVLDPAMGSGHFLVQAVDFITDRIVDFLNGFPWNPITAHLRSTRDQILKSLEDQRVSVDPGKLTDVNLLKRHVLKRCIYGVDVNPMAVELAKVSLWLDCFTLGAPLSFLDHHLRCGNSLIGVTADAVDEKLRAGTQANLFSGNRFAGVKSSVAGMIAIGELPDITPDQLKNSQSQYKRASSATDWAKRLLDIYTSQWFGNEPSRRRGGSEVNPALEFLGDKASELWAQSPRSMKLDALFAHVTETALEHSMQERFFHWQLEFPEVFLATGAHSVSGEVGGFDCVIGNPPFGASINPNTERFVEEMYSVSTGKVESYVYFLLMAGRLLRRRGYLGMVTPNVWLTIRSYDDVRLSLFNQIGLVALAETPSAFEDAWVNTVSVIARRALPHARDIEILRPRMLINGTVVRATTDQPWPIRYSYSPDRVNPSTGQVHFQVSPAEHVILQRIMTGASRVQDIALGTTGFQAYHNTKHSADDIRRRFLHSPVPLSDDWKRYISGTDIHNLRWSYGDDDYINYAGDLYRQPDRFFFTGTRLVIQEIAARGERKVHVVVLSDEIYSDNTTLVLKPKSGELEPAFPVLAAIFTSRFFTWFLLKTSDKPYASGDFSRMNVHDFLRLPLPPGLKDWAESTAARSSNGRRNKLDRPRGDSHERFEELVRMVDVLTKGENLPDVDVENILETTDKIVFEIYGVRGSELATIGAIFDTNVTTDGGQPERSSDIT